MSPAPLTPLYKKQLEDGRVLFGVTAEDFDRIAKGYACGECLRTYDVVMVDCIDCGASMTNVQNAPLPPEWR